MIMRIFRTTLADIKRMSRKEHIYYWILPLLVIGVCVLFYFSGNPTLVAIVCPPLNWEWGILENLQLAILIGIFIVSTRTAFQKKDRILKLGFGLIAVFSVFVFLEEIDYGTHFYQLIKGHERSGIDYHVKSLHNYGSNAKIIKRSVYLIMALIFVMAPFLKSSLKNPYLKFLLPSPRIILVAILTIASDLVPRLIVTLEIRSDGGLGVNIGEFSEVMVYYIFLLYVIQLAKSKYTPVANSTSTTQTG